MSGHRSAPRAGVGAGAGRDESGVGAVNSGTELHYLPEAGGNMQANLRALVGEARRRGEADGLRLREAYSAPVIRAYVSAFETMTGRPPEDLPADLRAHIEALLAAGGAL